MTTKGCKNGEITLNVSGCDNIWLNAYYSVLLTVVAELVSGLDVVSG